MSDLLRCEVSAPGKVILHGEHSVVYGRTAIAGSLGLRTYAILQEQDISDEPKLKIVLPNIALSLEIAYSALADIISDLPMNNENLELELHNPSDINHDEYLKILQDFINYFQEATSLQFTAVQQQSAAVVLYLFCAIFKVIENESSLELNVESKLNVGAGIGSSASFAVALTGVMFQYLKRKNPVRYFSLVHGRPVTLEETAKINKRVFSDKEKILISGWAYCAEKIAHGTPSGVDNATCTFGSIVEFRKGMIPVRHNLNVKLRIALVNTKVSRQTKDLVQKVKDLKEKCPEVVECILDAMNELSNTALKVLKLYNNIPVTDETQKERTDHFNQLIELFDLNHKLLASLDVSHDSLEKVRAITKENGFICKLTGAGGGGYAIVLIPPKIDEVKVFQMIVALKDKGFDVKLTDIGGVGVAVHNTDENYF